MILLGIFRLWNIPCLFCTRQIKKKMTELFGTFETESSKPQTNTTYKSVLENKPPAENKETSTRQLFQEMENKKTLLFSSMLKLSTS